MRHGKGAIQYENQDEKTRGHFKHLPVFKAKWEMDNLVDGCKIDGVISLKADDWILS